MSQSPILYVNPQNYFHVKQSALKRKHAHTTCFPRKGKSVITDPLSLIWHYRRGKEKKPSETAWPRALTPNLSRRPETASRVFHQCGWGETKVGTMRRWTSLRLRHWQERQMACALLPATEDRGSTSRCPPRHHLGQRHNLWFGPHSLSPGPRTSALPWHLARLQLAPPSQRPEQNAWHDSAEGSL